MIGEPPCRAVSFRSGDQFELAGSLVAVFVSRSMRSRMHRTISLFWLLPFRSACVARNTLTSAGKRRDSVVLVMSFPRY
ncbi:hypothetical protein X768_04695 [Mesorhizobium sp. LSJC265A00]|nr:hypothetical protein X768_04695 [Mesorhizobium sp. LSJC265A00]